MTLKSKPRPRSWPSLSVAALIVTVTPADAAAQILAAAPPEWKQAVLRKPKPPSRSSLVPTRESLRRRATD